MTAVMADERFVIVNGVTKRFVPLRSLHEVLGRPFDRPAPLMALDDVSFGAERGCLIGLFGPNGAGKTTLLKILATLLAPEQGEVRIAGRSPEDDPVFIKRNVGLVTCQERSFFWRLTGRENLAFFAALHGLDGPVARRRMKLLFDDFRVDDPDKRFDAYSSGTRQKFSFIRGLLHDPPLLLLDEPFSNLDAPTRRFLKNLLKSQFVARQKKTVLLATHEIAEHAPLCDRFLCLKAGRLCLDATAEGLRRAHDLDPAAGTQDFLINILEAPPTTTP